MNISRGIPATPYGASTSDRAAAETVELAPFSNVSWGGILAGVVIVLALQVVLNMVGVGIGLTTVEPLTGDSPTLGSFSLGAGIWLVVSTWIALAAGGFVASRIADSHHRDDALLHGLVTWGLTLIIGIVLLSSAIGAVATGAANVAGGAAKAVGQAVGTATEVAAPDLRQFINSRIQPTDATRMAPEELDKEIALAVGRMVANPTDSGVDRQRVVQLVAARTGLSEQEATTRLQEVETQARQTAEAAELRAREAADAAARAGSRATLWGALALLIGAIAAGVGGLAGRQDAQKYRLRAGGVAAAHGA